MQRLLDKSKPNFHTLSSNTTVKARVKEPTILQVSLTRFLYIGYLEGNEAVQVLKLVLFSFKAFRDSFDPIQASGPSSLEFKRSYSQQKFVEESEISRNPMKSFQSILRVLCYKNIWCYQFV